MTRARAEHAADAARQRRITRLARRDMRVDLIEEPTHLRIAIARKSVGDALIQQLPWGMGFAAINPGVFVVIMTIGLLQLDFVVAIVLWLVTLFALNVAYARLANRGWYLDITNDRLFALHRGNPQSAKLVGQIAELQCSLDEHPDPSKLHDIRLRDGRGEIEIEALTDRDITVLRGALSAAGAKV